MKPRTKLQKRVMECSKMLPSLTQKQVAEALDKISPAIAKVSGKTMYCLDCGGNWKVDGKTTGETVVCPHCGKTLCVDKSRKRVYRSNQYVARIMRFKEFQVVRMFMFETVCTKGMPIRHKSYPVFERWYDEEGNDTVVARLRVPFSYYADKWNLYSDMEIRHHHYVYDIHPNVVIGKITCIPRLKRNGFNGNFHKCPIYDVFKGLLSNNKIETLWKCDMYEMVQTLLRTNRRIETYWIPLRIALRHKYLIQDSQIWLDMIDMLRQFGKDDRNPKLICPENLIGSHDELMQKHAAQRAREHEQLLRQRERQREIEYLKNLEKAKADNEEYLKNHSRYFGLIFTDAEITVEMLKSVQDFIEEGKLMHHCVFANNYYKKADTLIFHALIDGVSIATIEFSLSTFKIVQCRGKHNSIPQHKERIIELIAKNIWQIEKCKKTA